MTIVVTIWDILCLIVIGIICVCMLAGLIIHITNKIKSNIISKKHREINKYDK